MEEFIASIEALETSSSTKVRLLLDGVRADGKLNLMLVTLTALPSGIGRDIKQLIKMAESEDSSLIDSKIDEFVRLLTAFKSSNLKALEAGQ